MFDNTGAVLGLLLHLELFGLALDALVAEPLVGVYIYRMCRPLGLAAHDTALPVACFATILRQLGPGSSADLAVFPLAA